MRISVSKRSLIAMKGGALVAAALLPVAALCLLVRGGADSAPPSKKPSGRAAPAARASALRPRAVAPHDTDRDHEHEHEHGTASAAVPLAPPTPEKRRAYISRLCSDAEEADRAFEELLDDEEALCDAELLAALLALARDPRKDEHARELALDVIGRSHAADEDTVARLRELALANELGAEARTWAIVALRQLAADRLELEAPLRAALLDAATSAPTPEARADAVDGISTRNASFAEVVRVSNFLQDADSEVRSGAARALASSPAANRLEVAASLERALHAESTPEAGAALLAAALEVGRGDAEALLERLSATPLVRANAVLARQVADYRAALRSGETSVETILKAHEDLEESRVR